MKTALVLSTALALVSLGAISLPVQADHAMTKLYEYMDAGYAVSVTPDGRPDPHAEYVEPVIFFSADEYAVEFEHPEDLLSTLPNANDAAEGLPVGEWTDAISLDELDSGPSSPPYSKKDSSGNWHWHAYILPASDSSHDPSGGCNYSKTNTGLQRFETNFYDDVYAHCYSSYTCFNASGIGDDASDLLSELRSDVLNSSCSWMRGDDNRVVIGWVDNSNHNGIAYRDGFYSLNSEAADGGVDWDHDEIIQHEVSHNFDAPDRGTWGWEGDGIMNYWDAYTGTTWWDSADKDIVRDNIWGCSSSCTE